MNAVTAGIFWMTVQIAVFSLLGFAAYLVLRRRGPKAAATCAATVLVLTLPLAILVASPWPSWLSHSENTNVGSQLTSTSPIRNHAADGADLVDSSITLDQTNQMSDSALAVWWQTASDFASSAGSFRAAPDRHVSAWQAWVPWLLAAGIGFGIVRLAAGMWSISRLRRSSRPIEDEGVLAQVRGLAARVDSTIVELRESPALRSAATIGWRRPVLLLPADWRTWTESERRIVLAHEMAHVARKDYLTAILARLVTAVHFYQPLVLWLGRQLRIQQELAADNEAASLAGDRQSYLTTLAQLALRADDRPLPWPARAFLPGTSMLIKRVAWLKRKNQSAERSLTQAGRWALAVVMTAFALGVAGIRGPSQHTSSLARADEPKPAQQDRPQADPILLAQRPGTTLTGTAQQLRTLQYLPADAKFVAVLSPSEMAKAPSAAKMLAALSANGFEKQFGLSLADLEDIELVAIDPMARIARSFGALAVRGQPAPEPEFDRVVLRTVKPFDWKQTLAKNFPAMKRVEVDGHEYFSMDPASLERADKLGPSFYVPDDRTLIAGTEEEVRRIIRGGDKVMDDKDAFLFTAQQFRVRVDASMAKQLAGMEKPAEAFDKNPLLAMFLPLIDHVNVAALSGNIQPPGDVRGKPAKESALLYLELKCDSADGAQQVAKTLEAARTIGTNLLAAKAQAWQQSPAPPVPQGQIVAMNEFIDVLKKALADAQIRADGSMAGANVELEIGPTITAGFVMPAVAASREAAMRQQSFNNMRQLALAMHNHLAAKNVFPPAAIRDKNGKPLLSWRVAILPYLEQQQLYQEFHLDEPWDSEHNKALIAKMPVQFRDPHEDEKSTNSSYFMPTGKGMFGDDERGRNVMDIKDGTSHTIMLVEAKRDIPWTKPEDIEIDPDPSKPLPKLGGHMTNGWAAGLADGSVRFISDTADPKLLRAFFTVAGGEVVDDAQLNPPGAAPPSPQNPQTRPPQSSNEADRLNIAVSHDAEGKLVMALSGSHVSGSRVSEDQLRKVLADLPDDARKAVEATIAASKETPYNDVVRVMDILNQAGIQKVSISAKADAQSPVGLRQAPPRAMGTLVDLVLLRPVMQELGLQEDSPTVTKLRALNERLAKEAQEAGRKPRESGETPAATLADSLVRKRPDTDPELEALLTPEQFARLKGIHLQMHGPHALAEPDVEAALAIDAQQKEKIIAAIQESINQQRALFAGPGQFVEGLSGAEFTKKVQSQTEERDKKIDAVLSAEQKAKWAQMKGKQFDMSAKSPTADGRAFPDRLIPKGPAKIEFRLAEHRAGEGLQNFALELPNGTQTLVYLQPEPALTSDDVAKAAVVPSTATKPDGSPADNYSVEIAFTEDGAKKMAKVTEQNIGKLLAIVLDGKVISAATIRSAISQKAQISGNFTQQQAEQIANSIRRE
jgi:beta-lactamase regulating signal transducer with metallopeptidase domain/biopolymer transport protein ExbD